MKEIGIEKLILLYYEYELDLLKRDMRVNGASEREIELADIEKVDEDELEKNLNKLSDLKPFIGWLVENEKVNPYDPSYNVPTHIALGVDDGDGDFMVYERFFKEEELLMLLSIQDEPINFLVSILK